jgi:hypothetical protein
VNDNRERSGGMNDKWSGGENSDVDRNGDENDDLEWNRNENSDVSEMEVEMIMK